MSENTINCGAVKCKGGSRQQQQQHANVPVNEAEKATREQWSFLCRFFFLRPMFMRCILKGHFSLKSHKEARETLPTDLLAKQRNIPDEKS